MTLTPPPEALAPEPPPPPPTPPEVPVQVPILWILEHAPPPVQYRALTEVAKLAPLPPLAPALTYGFVPALRIAIHQQVDGVWNRCMLALPKEKGEPGASIGTIPAVRRFLELGWERDSPPLLSARRVLFRLLAEDNDPSLLYELADDLSESDPELVQRGRLLLREAAAAALAQAGYEMDPRLRGCAHRMLTRVGDFLSSPLAAKPWVRIGNRHVLSPDASPPSMHLLHTIAFMPHYRSEHYEFIESLYEYLSRPLPRQEVQQVVGAHILPQPHLVLGDPLATRVVADADIPFALYWLELMARLGFLKRNENWLRLFERFLDERDRDHVWRPEKGVTALTTTSHHAWPAYPLGPAGEPAAIAADVTFRLALIARLAGRPIELT